VTSSLFLSPHPDDLVYSAFSALLEHSGVGRAVIFFNVSRFTKWGLLPKYIVTMMRTLEERIILTRLRVRPSFLWMEDSSSRSSPINGEAVASKLAVFQGAFQYIFCPLGISRHSDHMAVRSAAIDYWLTCGKKPRIRFYEDLPYAARMRDIDFEVETCVRELSRSCGRLSTCYHPMNADQFKRKLFFNRMYLTQNDHSRLLKKHAEELGKKSEQAFAERYFCSP
jgi:LmbE family N-acetylglucosaminyl deacetylase